jgi:hypothetical protein
MAAQAQDQVVSHADVRYELWGLQPANLIDTFDSEPEALAEVRALLDNGWAAEDLSLGRIDDRSVVEGEALASLAAADGNTRRAGPA